MDPSGDPGHQRVVLNPWLSCVPRGVSPICPACEVGDLSLCWNFQTPPLAPGIHIGTSSDVPGGWANLMPAHPSMLFPVPDSIPDEVAAIHGITTEHALAIGIERCGCYALIQRGRVVRPRVLGTGR